jgi:hypothetical protein
MARVTCFFERMHAVEWIPGDSPMEVVGAAKVINPPASPG